MRTVVVATDAGRGYLKAMGNPEGEHRLACELIGTSLADWLGLTTLDYALLRLDATQDEVLLEADDSIPLAQRDRASTGPAFITRAVKLRGGPWNGDPQRLQAIINPSDIAGLVLLDTWLANHDRYPRRPPTPATAWRNENLDNVMLARTAPGQRKARIVAMDFTHCLFCKDGALRTAYPLELVQDDGIYGAFEAFRPYVTEDRAGPFLARMRGVRSQDLEVITDRIPHEWGVGGSARHALIEFLVARGTYLADRFLPNFAAAFPSPETKA